MTDVDGMKETKAVQTAPLDGGNGGDGEDGEAVDFGSLPPTMLLTKKRIAAILGNEHVRAVERAVKNGELPPPSLYMQHCAWWRAGDIQAHIDKRIRQRATDLAKLARRM